MFGLSILTNKWLWIGILAIALSAGAMVAVGKYNSAIEEAVMFQSKFEDQKAETEKQKIVAKAAVDSYNELVSKQKEFSDQLAKVERERNVYRSKVESLTKRLYDSTDSTALDEFNARVREQLECIQGGQFDDSEVRAATTAPTVGDICLSPEVGARILNNLKKECDNYKIIYKK